MTRLQCLAATITILVACGFATAGVLNVPGDYDEIHDAVQACVPGDTVLVAAGTFNDCTHVTLPDPTPACVVMKSGVTLIGAGPDATIIDAEAGPGVFDGRGIVVDSVLNCRIENLQVTGAFAADYGAAILIRNVDNTVEVTDVKIFDNGDGGIICRESASPILTRVDFIDNLAKLGGGLAIEENSHPGVFDCLLDNNTAPAGAGIMIRVNSNPEISGCIVQNNYVGGNGAGGGIAIVDSEPDIHDCEIAGNTTPGSGGGIHYQDSGGTLTACYIHDNTVTGDFSLGAGMYLNASGVVCTDVVIAGNTTTGFFGEGGGIYNIFTPAPTFQNCTVAENACGDGGFGGGITCALFSAPIVDKCIVAAATTGQGFYCTGTPVAGNPQVSCTDVHGNAGGDAICGKDLGDNFSHNPRFCYGESAENDYDLGLNSPCAAGNHPSGPATCGGELIGARPVGCGVVGVDDLPANETALLGNAPNPFNPRTRIFFVIGERGPATLRIYDVRGREVTVFRWEELAAGPHEVIWDGTARSGRPVSSGVYFCQLDDGAVRQTQRMALIR